MPPSKAPAKLSELLVTDVCLGASNAPTDKAKATKRQTKKFPCDKDCRSCKSHYRSHKLQMTDHGCYDNVYSKEKAGEIIRGYRDETASRLIHVRWCVDNHGDTIAKRWNGYPVSKRATLLREVMPGMSRTNSLQARFAAAREEQKGSSVARTPCWRSSWLLSTINLETLSRDPDRLLTLLHSRSSGTPEQLLILDLESTSAAFQECLVKVNYNCHCVIVCPEAGSIGDMAPFESMQVHRGDTVGFPRAELAFEAGHELSDMLLKLVTRIMSINDGTVTGRATFDSHVATTLSTLNRGHFYSEGVYKSPSTTGLDHLFDMLISGYPKPRRKHMVQAMLDAIRNVSHAERTAQELRNAVEVFRLNQSGVRRGQPLPIAYDRALGLLRSVLERHYIIYKCSLKSHMSQNSAFQDSFSWNTTEVEEELLVVAHPKPEEMPTLRKDPLFWCILQVCRVNSDETLASRTARVRHIEELLQSEVQKKRLDQGLYDQISILTTVNEVINELAGQVPYGSGVGRDSEMVEIEFFLKELDILPNSIQAAQKIRSQLLELLKSLMEAPLPKPTPTREALHRTRNLHSVATSFWDSFLAAYYKTCSDLQHETRAHLEAYRDPEHMALVEAEYADLEAAVSRKEQASQNGTLIKPQKPQPQFAPQTVWGEESAPSVVRALGRHGKSAARSSQAETSEAVAMESGPSSDSTLAEERIPVGPKSLKLFNRMYGPSREALGPVKWDAVATAFTDAGLSMRPTGGSMYSFSHTSKGSIVFHRPHPQPIVNAIHLKGFAKRLEWWFGWNAETFVPG
ncbi:hypothetical protein LTR97_009634 [Elasticomyces elasticus]|uniref:Uncharacterized protein n=1 Tax=Elasticomyces elasticus TaxID=574655 RepID=A0AAN7ZX14_9PEZI|nr:hypothetical protein LTR97_009634 [Elasticomyces elasticus]